MEDNLLDKAISLYKTGNNESAGELLKKLVKQEPNNEAAWLWLAACADNDNQKLYCVNKVLEINPNNPNAISAKQRLTASVLPQVDEIVAKPPPARADINSKPMASESVHQFKPKKKWNKAFTCLVFPAFLLVLFSGGIALLDKLTPTTVSDSPQTTVGEHPTAPPSAPGQAASLTIQAGTLSQYANQIGEKTIVNVYQSDGTLDRREDDLKQLCLDWLYYRAKIMEYESSGDNEKAKEARIWFNSINIWLGEYNEDDVQSMFTIIDENNWSNW